MWYIGFVNILAREMKCKVKADTNNKISMTNIIMSIQIESTTHTKRQILSYRENKQFSGTVITGRKG